MVTGVVVFVAVMVLGVVPAVWLLLRVERADRKKIERIREDWEAAGRKEPWKYNFPSGGGGNVII